MNAMVAQSRWLCGDYLIFIPLSLSPVPSSTIGGYLNVTFTDLVVDTGVIQTFALSWGLGVECPHLSIF